MIPPGADGRLLLLYSLPSVDTVGTNSSRVVPPCGSRTSVMPPLALLPDQSSARRGAGERARELIRQVDANEGAILIPAMKGCALAAGYFAYNSLP